MFGGTILSNDLICYDTCVVVINGHQAVSKAVHASSLQFSPQIDPVVREKSLMAKFRISVK